jgi:hypothetical protein
MDSYTRKLLDEAYALDDAYRAKHEQPEAKQAKPQREMIYKTCEKQSMPQHVRDLEPEVQARWDAWADAKMERRLETYTDVIGEECGLIEKRLREEIKKLAEEVGQLRAEITVLQGIRRGEIASFKFNSGKADDDAA